MSNNDRATPQRGFLAPSGSVGTTAAGRTHPARRVGRRRLLLTFLIKTLGYTYDDALDEAKNLERSVSDAMVERRANFVPAGSDRVTPWSDLTNVVGWRVLKELCVRELVRSTMAPLMHVWAAVIESGLDNIPQPIDAPFARSRGNDSDHILILGSGPAVGWGVLRHDLALPGALARALSASTRRGANVNVVASPQITVRSVIDELDALRLWHYDAIVLTLGVNDALTLTSLRSWRRGMSAVLQLLKQACPATHVFVLGIPPIRSIPVFDSAWGSVADHHARELNRATAHLCTGMQGTTFVTLTAAPEPTPGRHRSAADYRHWARLIASRMSAPLDASRNASSISAADPTSAAIAA